MKIQVLGAHNCESRSSRLVSLLVDGVLAIDAGGLTSSLSFAAQLRLKAILLTHHHYDHIRDIPAIAMNAYLRSATINLYSTPSVRDTLATHLLNDDVYPDFFKRPAGKPTINFKVLQLNRTRQIAGYRVLATPMGHAIPAVGFQVTSSDGKSIFYTGDTGPGLADCWKHVSPEILFIEVTAPNKFEDFAKKSGHMTPCLLEGELANFQRLKGYLPQVVVMHVNPKEQKEIAAQLAEVSASLGAAITLAKEGMLLQL